MTKNTEQQLINAINQEVTTKHRILLSDESINPNYHVEITLTLTELRDIVKYLKRLKKIQLLRSVI